MSTVLDLPIEQQQKLADLEGVTHKDWVKATKNELASADAFRDKLDANEGARPEGMSEDDVKRFQKKIDSGNPR